jgi:L-iditol 2-dehydrogenase
MLVGMGTPNHTLPLSEAGAREIDLMPTWRYADCYEEAISLMNQAVQGRSRPDIRTLVTHHVQGLDEVELAFSLARSPRDPDGKLVIKVVVRN